MCKAIRKLLHRLAAFVLLAIALLVLPAQAAPERLPVVASFSILGDLTQKIGGEHVQVHSLVGNRADPHVYQPTPADARIISRARLVVVNGLGFEGWIDRLIRSSAYRGKLVVASMGIEALGSAPAGSDGSEQHHHQHDHGGAGVDPHAWQDPANVRRYVDNIAAALADVDPANKAVYQANAARLKQQLEVLDSDIRAIFSALPPGRRTVVTSHDAFAYFGHAYGIRFVSPVGVSTDAQPSAAAVGAIIRQIRQEKIKAIFIENINDPRLLERISQESGARIGGTLYSHALSPAGGAADSYLGMMRQNAKTLAAALSD